MEARDGRHDLVKVLLDVGASIEVKDKSGYTALHLAALSGDTGTIQLLLDARLDLNAQDTSGDGVTALHEAATNLDATRLLLKSGANINAQNKHMKTPLIQAADSEVFEVVRHLLNHHAKVNLLDDNGENVLHHAAIGNSAKIAKLLLQSGADVGVLNKDGRTPLMVAITSRQRSTGVNYDVIEELIVPHPSRGTLDPDTGNNVLHNFLHIGCSGCIEILLELELPFSLDDPNDKGLTPLLQAIHKGYRKEAILLIKHGADVNKKGFGDGVPKDTTPIIWATYRYNFHPDNLTLVQELLDAGANLSDVNEMGYTAFTTIEEMDKATDESVQLLHTLTSSLNVKKEKLYDLRPQTSKAAISAPWQRIISSLYPHNFGILPHVYLYVEAGANLSLLDDLQFDWLFDNAVNDKKYYIVIRLLRQKFIQEGFDYKKDVSNVLPKAEVRLRAKRINHSECLQCV